MGQYRTVSSAAATTSGGTMGKGRPQRWAGPASVPMAHEATTLEAVAHEATTFEAVSYDATTFEAVALETVMPEAEVHEAATFEMVAREVTPFDTVAYHMGRRRSRRIETKYSANSKYSAKGKRKNCRPF